MLVAVIEQASYKFKWCVQDQRNVTNFSYQILKQQYTFLLWLYCSQQNVRDKTFCTKFVLKVLKTWATPVRGSKFLSTLMAMLNDNFSPLTVMNGNTKVLSNIAIEVLKNFEHFKMNMLCDTEVSNFVVGNAMMETNQ